MKHGQYVALLQIQRDGSARLMRADANSPTYGGPDRESWSYNLTIGGPSPYPHAHGAGRYGRTRALEFRIDYTLAR